MSWCLAARATIKEPTLFTPPPFAILSAPVMPTTSEKMLAKLGLKLSDMPSLKDFDVKTELTALKAGTPFEIGDMLFERIPEERIAELKEKYGASK